MRITIRINRICLVKVEKMDFFRVVVFKVVNRFLVSILLLLIFTLQSNNNIFWEVNKELPDNNQKRILAVIPEK
jgi:hypothetical protein